MSENQGNILERSNSIRVDRAFLRWLRGWNNLDLLADNLGIAPIQPLKSSAWLRMPISKTFVLAILRYLYTFMILRFQLDFANMLG